MRKYIIIFCIAAAVSIFADIKIGVMKVEGPDFVINAMTSIDGLLAADSTIDLILGPAEALGGDTNKARISFVNIAGSIAPTYADTFVRSSSVIATVSGIMDLALDYGVTIIPGTVWEVDENLRCFETVPIIGPDASIKRLRRKTHYAEGDPFLDSMIVFDTLTTRDGSTYSYFIVITTEMATLPDIYPTYLDEMPDIYLGMGRHWMKGFHNIWEMVQINCPPDPAMLRLYANDWDDLYLEQIAEHNVPILYSCLDTLPGGVFSADLFDYLLPEGMWFDFDEIVETPFGTIFTFDPDTPLVVMQPHIAFHIVDTSGAPVESVFVNYGQPGEVPSMAGWTDADGNFTYWTCDPESLYFLFAKDSFMIAPEDTVLYIDEYSPACSLSLIAELDSTYDVVENDLPQKIALFAYPNPFNSSVSISAPTGSEVVIFDIRGNLVARLDIGEDLEKPSAVWRPNRELPTGVYFMRCRETGEEHKLIYMK